MPHLIIEYSGSLDQKIDISALCEALRRAMIETGIFPLAGIRVRAIRCDHWSVADGDPVHGFIDMSLRLRGGRTLENRESAADHVFAAAERFLKPAMETRSLALSLELRDIDPKLSRKIGTIRNHLKGN